jgi:hypothetical protein
MNLDRRILRVLAVLATTGAVLAVSAALTSAKDPKWIGPINQPPLGGSFGQATVELKVHFGRKSHGSKKFVPKNMQAKENNLYFLCADGQHYYPSDGGGDASTSTHVAFEETIFVKKNKTFAVTDSTQGDSDSGSMSITGKFHGNTASGTIRIENHRNNGSPPPNDPFTCDSGVLSWTAGP